MKGGVNTAEVVGDGRSLRRSPILMSVTLPHRCSQATMRQCSKVLLACLFLIFRNTKAMKVKSRRDTLLKAVGILDLVMAAPQNLGFGYIGSKV